MNKLKVLIPNYKYIEPKDGGKPYYVYMIHVNWHNSISNISRVYFVERRYSDFFKLHSQIRRQYNTPEFPPKRVRNTRIKVVETRRHLLEFYLQSMCSELPLPIEIISFLNIPVFHQHHHPQPDHTNDHIMSDELPQGGIKYENPAAAFFEDPFIESDSSSSNLSDSITKGVLDALYQ